MLNEQLRGDFEPAPAPPVPSRAGSSGGVAPVTDRSPRSGVTFCLAFSIQWLSARVDWRG